MPPKSATPKAKTGTAPAHASFQDMITDAIINLKERSGSSRAALKKYVKANNSSITVNDKLFDSLFNRAIRSGVEKGVFVQPKGASGTTKLAKKEPKPATAKPKKEAKPKTEKKPVVKKTATTKKTTATKPKVAAKPKKTAAPKKEAKPKVAKKPAATKPKKVAAPKTAPAIVEKPTVLSKTKSGRVTKSAPKTAPKKTATKKTPVKKATPKKA